jgi:DNA-3-methyladenine glycosylase
VAADLERLRPLPRAFFQRDAVVLARALIGTRIVVRESGKPRVARIVETEAYCGPTDLACHARVGLTKRTKTMYGPPGHAYVFLIYGMYDCFNVVGGVSEGSGHAVLVRAVEPMFGIAKNAGTDGPGKLTRALAITRKDNAADLVDPDTRIFIAERGDDNDNDTDNDKKPRIGITARVGVAYAGEWADRPWRFLDRDSRHVSKPPARSIGRPAAAGAAAAPGTRSR